jgi:hypothetical protein
MGRECCSDISFILTRDEVEALGFICVGFRVWMVVS